MSLPKDQVIDVLNEMLMRAVMCLYNISFVKTCDEYIYCLLHTPIF